MNRRAFLMGAGALPLAAAPFQGDPCTKVEISLCTLLRWFFYF